jgi:hypothetical protein
MSTRSREQSLTNWLILIPLTIVPAIAVFGVPRFGSLSADDSSGGGGLPDLTLGPEAAHSEGIPRLAASELSAAPLHETDGGRSFSPDADGWSDPFQSPGEVLRDRRPPPREVSRAEMESAHRGGEVSPALGEPLDSSEPPRGLSFSDPPHRAGTDELKAFSRQAPPDRHLPDRAAPGDGGEAAENLSWRAAVRRLNQLGVREIQLCQTEEPFVFRFSCDYTPGNNPRVTRRFEAEAGEPLKAVEKVIEQVETWLARPTP